MNPNLTEIACVIDRSGSMERVRTDAIGGCNTFLAAPQALPGEARWTLVLLDREARHRCGRRHGLRRHA